MVKLLCVRWMCKQATVHHSKFITLNSVSLFIGLKAGFRVSSVRVKKRQLYHNGLKPNNQLPTVYLYALKVPQTLWHQKLVKYAAKVNAAKPLISGIWTV